MVTAYEPTITGKRLLVTGASGQIAHALARRLAEHNEVWGIARFGDAQRRRTLEDAGVRTASVDLADPDFSRLPREFDHVLHLAAHLGRTPDYNVALDVNAVGTGLLLSHFRDVESALVMSTTGVYKPHPDPWHRYVETDPLGDPASPSTPGYGVCKVAQEAMARYVARAYGVRIVIGRMNASYGPGGGLPAKHLARIIAGEPVVLRHDPAPYSPIFEDDIARHVGRLLMSADRPPSVVNFGGDEVVTAQEWCAYLGELVGREPVIEYAAIPGSQPGIALNITRRIRVTGPDRWSWREGFRLMAEALAPSHLS
ncbi:NAD-dependent epimerase/dehydratase family protein [Streptomyces flaveolus]|uniref:NAD-dependent epimerase/dehydratase family protein n=1 Tax=Streptomyces flaveolus TaxID=67297 RepID=UPI0038058B3E